MPEPHSNRFLIFSFPLPKSIKYIYASFEQADKPSSRMTAILRNGDTPSFRPAAWYGQPRGSSVQRECTPAQGGQPRVVRAKSIQYNTRPPF
ncbi:hypothetical protein [Burkholderia latens]|uniref:hypothetical protein n=1 Tax=Burkholderia latens TaxID=488446 RepID=UPI001FC800D9|nr:hypothetical protein [Burkholderia latens]